MAKPIERIFLGWTEPALSAAAARLVDHAVLFEAADPAWYGRARGPGAAPVCIDEDQTRRTA